MKTPDKQRILTENKQSLPKIPNTRRATKDLKDSDRRFRTLVDNIPGAVYRCRLDKDWTMMFISLNIRNLSGYPASDFIDNRVRSYASIIHSDDRTYVEKQIQKALHRKKKKYKLEYRLVTAKGKIKWVMEQ